MKRIFSTLLVLCTAFLVGCGQKSEIKSEKDAKAIIKVNDSVITKNQFDDMFNAQINSSIFAAKGFDAKDPKNKLIYLIFKDRVINELIIKNLLSQEIDKRKIKVSDKDVAKTVEKLSKEIGGVKKLEKVLKKNKIKMEDFEETVRNDIKMKKLVESLAITKVSNNEVKKFYDKNKEEKFTAPDQVRAQHILISASEEDIKDRIESENPKVSETELNQKVESEMANLKAKATKILKEAKAKPEKFDELAKKYSEDFSSAKKGGDLGFFKEGDMVKPFSEAAFSLKPDTISEVVKTQFGYHIIKVTDRKKAGITPYNEVEADIKKYLEDQNKVKVLQKFVDGLKNTAKIEYIDESYNPVNIQKELKELAEEQKGVAPKTESIKK